MPRLLLNLLSFFPIHCNNTAISHIFFSLCSRWQDAPLRSQMVVPSSSPACRSPFLTEAVPSILQRFYYRIPRLPQRRAAQYLLKIAKRYDALYLWPDTPLKAIQQLKASGHPIFMERINCYQGKAKTILDALYTDLGYPPPQAITAQSIHRERSELALADFILCPSPEVKASFQALGLDEGKLLLTSYGWEPLRFPNTASRHPSEQFTVLFVGSVCVRKGAQVLLRAWAKSGIKGRLILCGAMEIAIAQSCRDILNRADVQHIPYTSDLTSIYAQADLFAFPSFEEGSPLVTYEAMAYGLPILTSPMGAGGIARHQQDGFILSPYEIDEWIEALRSLSNDSSLRETFGASAQNHVQNYTWDKVAARRAAQILERV
jgi:glycosyltransferase involved in cell wall biosynthesis